MLGLYGDAWETLERLPSGCRSHRAVYAVRLLICTGLKKWELGLAFASEITADCTPGEREAAGRFHLALAESLCAVKREDSAYLALRLLSDIWPEGREAALKSAALAPIL